MTTNANTIEHAVAIAYSLGQPYGQTIASEERDTPAYNLMGVPVSSSYRGIVIKNGKKFVVK